MYQKRATMVLAILLTVGAASGAAVVAIRTRATPSRSPSRDAIATELPPQGKRNHPARSLPLQPEAARFARRIGQRFAATTREQSVMTGMLVIGNEQRVVSVSRRQTDRGEQTEIALAGASGLLTWDADRGVLTGTMRAGAAERALVERLVLDSPDQFVLAHLRGASYFTVASDVRPAKAADDYSGPRWNIVRVDDPDRDAERRPQSSWRLYYLNAETGLIDRVVSQVQGEMIEAEVSGWSDRGGEQVPSQITWTRQGQTIMQFRLTDFSHSER